jgi:hypothetical protein
MKRVVITAVMLLLITLSYTQEKFVGQWFEEGSSIETVITYHKGLDELRVIAFSLKDNLILEEVVNSYSADSIYTEIHNKRNNFKAFMLYELANNDKLKVTMLRGGRKTITEYFR